MNLPGLCLPSNTIRPEYRFLHGFVLTYTQERTNTQSERLPEQLWEGLPLRPLAGLGQFTYSVLPVFTVMQSLA